MKQGIGWMHASIHLAILPPSFFPLRSSSQHAALLAAAAGQEMTCGHSVNCQSPPRERGGGGRWGWGGRGGDWREVVWRIQTATIGFFFPTLKIREGKRTAEKHYTEYWMCPPHPANPSPHTPLPLSHNLTPFPPHTLPPPPPLPPYILSVQEEKSVATN